MATCGCGDAVCNCVVQGGTNVQVQGDGSNGNPYVISATPAALQVQDTTSVDHTLTGTGTQADPWILSSTVIRDPAGDNQLVIGPNGLYVPPSVLDCDEVAACTDLQVVDSPTVDLGLAGAGSTASPWVLTAQVIRDPEVTNLLQITPNGLDVPCEAVQDCVGQGFAQGLIYDDALNQYRVRLSTDAGNTTIFGTDNGIYTPSSPVTLGCGLEFGGAGEVQVDTAGTFASLTRRNCDDNSDEPGTFPLPGPDTAGMVVYCDANGDLRTMPEKFTETGTVGINENLAPDVTVLPFTTSAIQLAITNPSSQYCMCGILYFAFIPGINGAPGTVIRMDHMRDMGDGLGFVATTGYLMDNRGRTATAGGPTMRHVLPIPVCLDPGETKTFQHQVRFTRDPAFDNGGAVTIGAVAREIYFVGTNL